MDNQLIVAIHTDRGPSTVGARLGQMGYQILDAQGLEQGIELALAQLPDLILYDAVTDPDETLVELARLDADADAAMIPVVALAAARLLEQGLAARLPHVDEIVGMPFVWEEFLARIQAQLARRARLHAAYARKLADLRRMALDGFNPELFGPFLAMLEQAELLSADPARAGVAGSTPSSARGATATAVMSACWSMSPTTWPSAPSASARCAEPSWRCRWRAATSSTSIW